MLLHGVGMLFVEFLVTNVCVWDVTFLNNCVRWLIDINSRLISSNVGTSVRSIPGRDIPISNCVHRHVLIVTRTQLLTKYSSRTVTRNVSYGIARTHTYGLPFSHPDWRVMLQLTSGVRYRYGMSPKLNAFVRLTRERTFHIDMFC